MTKNFKIRIDKPWQEQKKNKNTVKEMCSRRKVLLLECPQKTEMRPQDHLCKQAWFPMVYTAEHNQPVSYGSIVLIKVK